MHTNPQIKKVIAKQQQQIDVRLSLELSLFPFGSQSLYWSKGCIQIASRYTYDHIYTQSHSLGCTSIHTPAHLLGNSLTYSITLTDTSQRLLAAQEKQTQVLDCLGLYRQ